MPIAWPAGLSTSGWSSASAGPWWRRYFPPWAIRRGRGRGGRRSWPRARAIRPISKGRPWPWRGRAMPTPRSPCSPGPRRARGTRARPGSRVLAVSSTVANRWRRCRRRGGRCSLRRRARASRPSRPWRKRRWPWAGPPMPSAPSPRSSTRPGPSARRRRKATSSGPIPRFLRPWKNRRGGRGAIARCGAGSAAIAMSPARSWPPPQPIPRIPSSPSRGLKF